MAEGMLGLGSAGSTGLSQEFIDKLKAGDTKAKIDPYTKKLENWDKELEKIDEINLKTVELLDTIKSFDLYYSGGADAFSQVSANTAGTSVVFDAVDVSTLAPGTNEVNITQLAKRDVFQTNTFSDKDAILATGQDDADKLTISIGGGTDINFSTKGKTYDELAIEINAKEGLSASVEQVGDNAMRIVIRSSDSGTANALTITETGIDLGINDSDGDGTADTVNHTVTAQNLNATVDGIEYDVSANNITIAGNIMITAVELGKSSITVESNNTGLLGTLESFVEKYNELVELVDEEIYSKDSTINDKSSLKMMMTDIKNQLFSTYGPNDEKNIFAYGFGIDKSGMLNVDTEVLGTAISEDIDGLKSLFVGVAEKEGLGTQLKSYLDELDGWDGLLTKYGENMVTRKEKLETEKKREEESLDSKYSAMSQQFAAYTAIISQMEAAFGGMKMMIDQSSN